jgi:hypothetical protein
MGVWSDFNTKLHILMFFVQLFAKCILPPPFDKLTSSYSMFVQEDKACFHCVRSIVMVEGLRVIE